LLLAAQKGLRIPLVYNTSSYDALETLRLLDGVVDIYLPDLKYADEEAGLKYSKVPRLSPDRQEARLIFIGCGHAQTPIDLMVAILTGALFIPMHSWGGHLTDM
jgi:uncharacterized Fe-S radical SAM superfamily protein PflX